MLNSLIKAFSWLARSVVDPTRYVGLLIVWTGTMAAMTTMHYALRVTLGPGANRLWGERPAGQEVYDKVWRRVAAIDRFYQRGQLARDLRLGVFFGVSTTQTGIQRRLLDGYATAADRWLLLCGVGMSLVNLEGVTQPMLYCGLKPKVVVFGVHPQMLVGLPNQEDDQTPNGVPVVGRQFRKHDALPWSHTTRLVQKHWAVRNQAIVADWLRSQIARLRLAVFRAGGVSAEAACSPTADPWNDEPWFFWHQDGPNKVIAEAQEEDAEKRGQFKAENYHTDGAQARCLVRMINSFRELGSDVTVVIMPLRSTLRRRLPPQAKPCLFSVLTEAFPDGPPRVVDLETAIPDWYFTDQAHLSRPGADLLTRLLIEYLKQDDEPLRLLAK